MWDKLCAGICVKKYTGQIRSVDKESRIIKKRGTLDEAVMAEIDRALKPAFSGNFPQPFKVFDLYFKRWNCSFFSFSLKRNLHAPEDFIQGVKHIYGRKAVIPQEVD
ncbi:MAG: type II toxin-antitoxin system PemK/MazF family toxin [Ignavibacteria bacterium]|nr:type II toxin-antitoxin system PemK/MazF family toxin [Ignavibacteria bacterium]MCU7503441.1 type II toxin-antitoxin system PemK/MazF family toxin [Ignavibacteria bacterium]MCU7516227.1 type II toxin-antitoxin system PemK/MazF family toxin [Ignavibacteria bacterium]